MSTKIGAILGWDMAPWRALAYIRLWVQSLALRKTNRPKKKKMASDQSVKMWFGDKSKQNKIMENILTFYNCMFKDASLARER